MREEGEKSWAFPFLDLISSSPYNFLCSVEMWKCLWSLLRNPFLSLLIHTHSKSLLSVLHPCAHRALTAPATNKWCCTFFLMVSQHRVDDLDPSASKVLHWVSFNIALYYSWCIVDSTASIYSSHDKWHKLDEKFINFKCFVGNCYPEKFANCLLLWVMEKLLPAAWLMSFKRG